MAFIPHTDADVAAMLAAIGVKSIEDLFDEIPQSLRIGSLSGVPEELNEMQVGRLMSERARADGAPLSFIGAGAYEHHIPAAVWAIATRGEFYSAYTPYQAEASQGTLQLIYEFQSMIARLTAMEVANASMYDGASATAEAALMAVRANRKSKSARILVPTTLHPHYRKVAVAMASNQGLKFEELPYCTAEGITPAASLGKYDGEDLTALVIPQPNFFGRLEDVDALTDWAHARGALVIAVVNPTSLALLKPPGQWGARGRGYRRRRRPAARRAAVLGRPLLRLHDDATRSRAADARPHRRPHARCRRPRGLHAHAAGARAAHPPRQGDLEHLHQPGSGGDGGDHLHVAHGAAGTRAHGGRRARAHARAGVGADACAGRASGLQRSVFSRGGAAARSSGGRGAQGAGARRDSRRPRPLGILPELGNALLVCATETKTSADLDRYRSGLSDALQAARAA